MSVQINFNGKTYNSLDEMPPEARQAYEQAMALLADQDGNGLPDFVEGLLKGQGADALKPLNVLSAAHTQIVFNGQTYSSVDQMPPEARQAYEKAMGAFDQNRNGVPDALEQGSFSASAAGMTATTSTQTGPGGSVPKALLSPYTPAGVESDDPAARAGKRRAVVAALGVAVVVVLIALAGVAAFVLGGQLGR